MSENWCTIESDPGVFTELIQEIGVRGVQVEELYAMEPEFFEDLKPVYGLVFLFKWIKEHDTRPISEDHPADLFFANQVITNACATQAILSILLNIKSPHVQLGDELTRFKEFTQELPPDVRGVVIGSSDVIRKVHNSFARPEVFGIETSRTAEKDDDVYHFIAYIPFEGKLYELDGLKRGPVCLGECSTENWLEAVSPMIQQRVERYSQNEIRFNLLALVRDRKQLYNEQIQELTAKLKDLMETENNSAADNIRQDIQILKEKVESEEMKQKRWKTENIRRRHNYIPFLINLLKILAEKKELIPLVERAKAKKLQQQQQQQQPK